MGVALALDGRHLIGRYNNQIGFGNRGRRDVGEEVPPGWSMWGDVMASIWVAIRTTKKNENVKCYLINYPYLSDYGQTIFLSFFSVKGQSNRTRAM